MSEAAAKNPEQPDAKLRSSDIVIDDSSLSMAAKGVFLTIGLFGNSCDVRALVDRTRDDSDTVDIALRELAEKDYVSLKGGRVYVKKRPGLST